MPAIRFGSLAYIYQAPVLGRRMTVVHKCFYNQDPAPARSGLLGRARSFGLAVPAHPRLPRRPQPNRRRHAGVRPRPVQDGVSALVPTATRTFYLVPSVPLRSDCRQDVDGTACIVVPQSCISPFRLFGLRGQGRTPVISLRILEVRVTFAGTSPPSSPAGSPSPWPPSAPSSSSAPSSHAASASDTHSRPPAPSPQSASSATSGSSP